MASYSPITNILNFAVAFKPQTAFPLDARSMFGSYAEAVAAAATAENAGSSNTIYYIGEIITVYENDVVTSYQIQPDKSLKELGSSIVTDDKTIVTDTDGAISLKSFGVQYYAYHSADVIIESGDYTFPDTMPAIQNGAYVQVADVWYKCTADTWAVAEDTPKTEPYYTLTTGWKDGLEPKAIRNTENNGYELAWYEPSTTTIEGINSTIGTIQTSLENLQDTVADNYTALDGKIDTETSRATTAEAAIQAEVDILNGDAKTEGSVKKQIADAIALLINNPDETMNSIQELVDWVNSEGKDAIELANTVSSNTNAINAINTLLGTTLPETTSASTVIEYINEVAAELDTVNNTIGTLGTAAYKNTEDFATAAQGTKADTAVQSVTPGSANGYINVDGTEVKAYELPAASTTVLGGVKPDGTSITVTGDGVASIFAVDKSKVTGLDTAIETAKSEAVTESNEYTDTNAVKVTDVITDSNDVATDSASASTSKVLSEKAIIDCFTWKTTM